MKDAGWNSPVTRLSTIGRPLLGRNDERQVQVLMRILLRGNDGLMMPMLRCIWRNISSAHPLRQPTARVGRDERLLRVRNPRRPCSELPQGALAGTGRACHPDTSGHPRAVLRQRRRGDMVLPQLDKAAGFGGRRVHEVVPRGGLATDRGDDPAGARHNRTETLAAEFRTNLTSEGIGMGSPRRKWR